MKNEKRELSPEQRDELLKALKVRFEKNMDRQGGQSGQGTCPSCPRLS